MNEVLYVPKSFVAVILNMYEPLRWAFGVISTAASVVAVLQSTFLSRSRIGYNTHIEIATK